MEKLLYLHKLLNKNHLLNEFLIKNKKKTVGMKINL